MALDAALERIKRFLAQPGVGPDMLVHMSEVTRGVQELYDRIRTMRRAAVELIERAEQAEARRDDLELRVKTMLEAWEIPPGVQPKDHHKYMRPQKEMIASLQAMLASWQRGEKLGE